MKILLADDHTLLRAGLKQILADELAGVQFGEAASTPETIQRLHERRWDLLILDIYMPGRNGLEVLTEIRQNFPRLPVLVLTSIPEEQLAVRALKAGASGYLNKVSAPEELVKAARALMAGECYVSSTLAAQLAAELRHPVERPAHERLSDREFQVFQLMSEGVSQKEIAAALSLSVKTVSTFRTRVFKKLKLKNDIELARYAAQFELRKSRP